jgi:hypothetical protein
MKTTGDESIFVLPEYARAQFEFFCEAVRRLMSAKDELYGSIPVAEPTESLPITQNTMPSGEVVQNQPLQMKSSVVFQWDDIRNCNLDALAEQANSSAEERLTQVMPHFFDVFHRTCDAAGTATDAGGNPFSFELYLEGLNRIELQFDSDGNPKMPTLVMHPSMAERLRSLPPITSAQQKALDELIERKRTEFNARRRHRKLH